MRYFMNANAQSNGDYEVHNDICSYGKLVQRPLELGDHVSCYSAVQLAIVRYGSAAQAHRGQINGCYYCSNPCHTS